MLSPLHKSTHSGKSGVQLFLDLVAHCARHLGNKQVELGLQVAQELLLQLSLLTSPPLPPPPLVQVERPMSKADQPEKAKAEASENDT